MADYKSAYTGAQIDDAVSKAHQHNNKTILDNITAPYTTEEKTKIAGIESGAEVNAVNSVNGKTGAVVLTASDVGALPKTTTVPTKTSDLQNDSGYITGYTETDPTVPTHVKNITEENILAWNNKSDFSGNYEDLNGLPTIPSKTSELTNDSNFISSTTVTAFWNGTQSEYDALETYNDTTLYLITEE